MGTRLLLLLLVAFAVAARVPVVATATSSSRHHHHAVLTRSHHVRRVQGVHSIVLAPSLLLVSAEAKRHSVSQPVNALPSVVSRRRPTVRGPPAAR